MISGLEPACQSGPDVAAYPELLSPTLGEHVEQNVSLATSPGARLLRSVRALLVRRAEVCAIVPGSAPRKHAPPSGAPRQEQRFFRVGLFDIIGSENRVQTHRAKEPVGRCSRL